MSKLPDRPFLTQSFSPRGGGIDFLGLRAVNLRMLQEFLIPGINNATADFGTYCLATWIPWKFRQLAKTKEKFTYSQYREFREAIEIAIAFSQRPGSAADGKFGTPRTRIGVQQDVDFSKPLKFKNVNRTDATSLFAAPLYGPSLRYLQLVGGDAVADDGTSTKIPISVEDGLVTLLIHEVETSLKSSIAYDLIDQLHNPVLTSELLDDLGLHGLHPSCYRKSCPEVKQAFLSKFLVSNTKGDPADYRRLTVKLICKTIQQHDFTSPAQLRACWYSGLTPGGTALVLDDADLKRHRMLWALFQSRQIQRTILEVFLRCFELALAAGAASVPEAVSFWKHRVSGAIVLDGSMSLEQFIRSDVSTVSTASSLDDISEIWHYAVHEQHLCYDDIQEGAVNDEFERVFRMMGRWCIRTRKWLGDQEGGEFLAMGDRSRMSALWFSNWIWDRLSQPLPSLAEDIFSELVFSQHIKVALSRFDGQVQRLRFTFGDAGIIPTTATAGKLGQSPVRMADRLPAFLGLLSDLDVIKWQIGEPLLPGSNAVA